MLFGCDIAEHRRAVAGDLRGADRAGDVVIAWCDVGDQRSQRVERGSVAELLLTLHVLAHQMQRDVARTLDHHLHIVTPGAPGQLRQGVQLGELCLVVRVGDGPGAQPVAQREGDVVGGEDLTELVVMGVEEVLPVTRSAVSGT